MDSLAAATIRRYMRQLSGVDRVVGLSKPAMGRAIAHLTACQQHQGVHHFAVVGEGRSLLLSQTGWKCLEDAKVDLEGAWPWECALVSSD